VADFRLPTAGRRLECHAWAGISGAIRHLVFHGLIRVQTVRYTLLHTNQRHRIRPWHVRRTPVRANGTGIVMDSVDVPFWRPQVEMYWDFDPLGRCQEVDG